MGNRPRGQISYGIVLSDEEELPKVRGVDLDYAEQDGFCSAFDLMLVEDAGLTEDSPYEERGAAVKRAPVQLVWVGHYDYPRYVLAVNVKEAHHKAPDWGSRPVTLTIPPIEAVEAAKAWCEAHDVEWEPRWILSSYYG